MGQRTFRPSAKRSWNCLAASFKSLFGCTKQHKAGRWVSTFQPFCFDGKIGGRGSPPHGWNTAIGVAADLHLVSLLPVGKWIEFHQPAGVIDEIVSEPFEIDSEGMLAVPTGPGQRADLAGKNAQPWLACRDAQPVSRGRVDNGRLLHLPGVPALTFVNDFERILIHTARDTIDLMSPDELAFSAEVIAAAVAHLSSASACTT